MRHSVYYTHGKARIGLLATLSGSDQSALFGIFLPAAVYSKSTKAAQCGTVSACIKQIGQTIC